MRNPKWTAGAAALCAGVGLFAISATAATAVTAANVSDCLKSAREVRAAIENSQDSAKLSDAKRHQRYGLDYCNHGLYSQGVNHYAAALRILGAGDNG